MEENCMIPRNDPIEFTFSKSDFVHIFKACEDRKEKLDKIQHESSDEDEIADAGNDLVEINMIIRELRDHANKVWGESGWTTSDEYL